MGIGIDAWTTVQAIKTDIKIAYQQLLDDS